MAQADFRLFLLLDLVFFFVRCCGGLFATTSMARSKRDHASGLNSTSLLDLAMPRQPYLQVVPQPRGVKYDLGTRVIGQRPDLESIIASCLRSWPFVEAEMTVLLGQLLGTKSEAALAVFQALRRSSAQREAISVAAKPALNVRDNELIGAVLNVHKSIEAERNALAHGHFGIASNLPDALIWQNTTDYVWFRTDQTLKKVPHWDEDKHQQMLRTIWVYRKNDLETIHREIRELMQLWFDLTRYLQINQIINGRQRDVEYRRLCDLPRVAQELENIRRKNNPSTQLQEPQSDGSG